MIIVIMMMDGGKVCQYILLWLSEKYVNTYCYGCHSEVECGNVGDHWGNDQVGYR